MTQGKDHSGTQHASTDDLLSDYLNDMFGSEPPCATEEALLINEPLLVENLCQLEGEVPEKIEASGAKSAVSVSTSKSGGASYERKAERSGLQPHKAKTLVLDDPERQECAVSNILNESRPSISEAIPLAYSLVPTINLTRHVDDDSFRTQSEAQIILLSLLFFLRRPLSPKVRQCFLNFSEQAIDDYHAAFWLSAHASKSSL
jgi:hypothetical protein